MTDRIIPEAETDPEQAALVAHAALLTDAFNLANEISQLCDGHSLDAVKSALATLLGHIVGENSEPETLQPNIEVAWQATMKAAEHAFNELQAERRGQT